jgi:SPP1 gp7 family putative phage head morphogenesis protein|nr:MAG TPA: minor capsid protein [Caudoviricetes sp.]
MIKTYKQVDIEKVGKIIPITALIATKKIKKYLDAKEPELVFFLHNLWNNQGKAITYKELREAIIDGYLSEKLLEEWYQDYTKFVVDKVAPMWADAMKEANSELYKNPKFYFDPMQQEVVDWTNTRAAMFVTNVTKEQVAGIREVVKRASQLNDMNVDELSRAIRPMVGLDYRQSIANMNYYTKMIENGVKPNTALEKSIKYSARQNRHRAYRIARTELVFAYNQGSYYGTKQAQEQGLLGRVEKVWCTAEDERTCEICGALEGKRIAMDDDFDFKTKLIEPGIKRVPPAHPHCRCTVIFDEVEPPIQAVEIPEIIKQ